MTPADRKVNCDWPSCATQAEAQDKLDANADRIAQLEAENQALKLDKIHYLQAHVDAKAEAVREWADERVELIAAKFALRAEVEGLKAEINARKGDPVTRLHNLCRGLGEPLDCGHDLSNYCDYCETCGECRDAGEGKYVVGKLDARIASLEAERDEVIATASKAAAQAIALHDTARQNYEHVVSERDAALKRAEEADNDYAILSIASTALEHDYNAVLALNAKLVEALREIEWSNDSAWQQLRATTALDASGKEGGGK